METKDYQKFINEFTERFVKDFNELTCRYGIADGFIELMHIVSVVILTSTLNIDDVHKAADVFAKEINVDIDNYYKNTKANTPS